ncbi:MAG: cobalamin-binding protein [Proteobacteria bacterium]|nr:cobalamin-binding protein [Pseudomonadota bacterium]
MADLNEISLLVQKGNFKEVERLTREALQEGVSAQDILDGGLIAAMSVIGERFKRNEIYVPEVLLAARAMKAGMGLLKPILADTGVEPVGRVVLGTVKGDQHDIGKNLVGMMLEGAGFEVIDLGVDTPTERFVEAAREKRADIVGMSALLTTTMPHMKAVIEALESGRVMVKTMVGGAPVTQRFADEIRADAFGRDAAVAVEKAKELIEKT